WRTALPERGGLRRGGPPLRSQPAVEPGARLPEARYRQPHPAGAPARGRDGPRALPLRLAAAVSEGLWPARRADYRTSRRPGPPLRGALVGGRGGRGTGRHRRRARDPARHAVVPLLRAPTAR